MGDAYDLLSDVEPEGESNRLIWVIAALVVLSIGGAVFYFIQPKPEEAVVVAPSTTPKVKKPDIVITDEEVQLSEAEKKAKTNLYFPILKSFFVTYTVKGAQHVLKTRIELVTHKQETIEKLPIYLPFIRANILDTLSEQDFEGLRTQQGRENAKQRVLINLRKFMKKETGDPSITDVLFKKFLMQ